MARHSTRSTLATLPPASPDAGSERGLYLSNLTYTTTCPGLHSSVLKMNGPEPINSEICVFASVSATRLSIMKGTLDEALPSAGKTSRVGSLSLSLNVCPSPISKLSAKLVSNCRDVSFCAQRLIEATQSSEVTA